MSDGLNEVKVETPIMQGATQSIPSNNERVLQNNININELEIS